MVTFILGNSIKKRAYFSKIENTEELYIDDMRIACDVVKDGVYCYALEDVPFKNMRVDDYVAYSRSLFDKEITCRKYLKRLLKSVGYGGLLRKKLYKLSECDYFKVLLASRLKETTRTVYFNLDTWKYSAKNRRKMWKFLDSLSAFSICVLVSDIRFCGYDSDVLYLTATRDLVLLDGECKRKQLSKRKIYSLLKTESLALESTTP